jgi:hypothetical protein
MKYLWIAIFFLSPTIIFSQSEKEKVYILFNETSKKTCNKEDGRGNLLTIKMYKKESKGKKINFHICDETFTYTEGKSEKDTCNIKVLKKVKLQNLDYLLKKYNLSEDFKHHVFEKIYIVEKISKDEIVKYDVYWSGEWTIE